MARLFQLAFLILLATVPAVHAAERTNRALVVAVSSYPNLPKKYVLKGPGNDARLIRETLQRLDGQARFDPENIVVLSDAVDGARRPTLAAIVEALDSLAAESQDGDFVYLHFAGHGSYQPAGNPDEEVDGKDEVFLPLDVGTRRSDSNAYPNGLVDDVIGRKLEAIRATGAFVWVVFDACQSATATRAGGGGPEASDRWVDPLDVGFSPSDFAIRTRSSGSIPQGEPMLAGDETGRDGDNGGGMVAFYAAQTIEPTPELPRPKGAGPDSWYGLFTYTLFSKIASQPGLTFRQLGQSVMSDYIAQNRFRPTPYFEGDLDGTLFLAEGAAVPRQWPLMGAPAGLGLPAGTLHLLAEGSKLAIVERPEDATAAAIGYAEVRSAGALSSKLGTIDHADKKRLLPKAVPAGSYGRLIENSVDFSLAVSIAPGSPAHAAEAAALRAAVERIAADASRPMNLAVMDADQEAALRLVVLDDAEMTALSGGPPPREAERGPLAWFLPASGEVSSDPLRRPSAIRLPDHPGPAFDDALADDLLAVFRATGLARLSGAAGIALEGVQVAVSVSRSGGVEEAINPAAVTGLLPGDMVRIAASNSGREPVDLNVLYVDRNYAITHWLAERLHEGFRLEKRLFQQGDEVFGDERLVVVVTRAGALMETEDLSFLVQRGVRDPAYRSPADGAEFEDALHALFAAPPTRASMVYSPDKPRGMVLVYPILARPAP